MTDVVAEGTDSAAGPTTFAFELAGISPNLYMAMPARIIRRPPISGKPKGSGGSLMLRMEKASWTRGSRRVMMTYMSEAPPCLMTTIMK